MARNGLILMTALVPTIGHRQLVQFALDYVQAERQGDYDEGDGSVFLLINSRDREPTTGEDRVKAFEQEFGDGSYRDRVHVLHYHGEVPQNPEDDPDFWPIWRDLIDSFECISPGDIVFASEAYGAKVAEVMECEFVPYDIARQVLPIKGTDVRHDIVARFPEVMPAFRKVIRKTVTIFGAESVGKTHTSRHIANKLGGQFVPEWAREYLETVGPEVTDEKMDTITRGQYALQKSVANFSDKHLIVQDTDLFSTLGYYRIFSDGETDLVRELALKTKSDLYIVMSSDIAFEEDPLRYGGGVRESSDKFWIDLLEEFGCNYVVVDTHDLIDRLDDATGYADECFIEGFRPIKEFVRD